MSILIFVRVLENSSQRAYFRSCDENTATPLADKREIGRFMGFPVPYWKISLVCLQNYGYHFHNFSTFHGIMGVLFRGFLMIYGIMAQLFIRFVELCP